MAIQKVTTVNKSGQTSAVLLNDDIEAEAEMITYLQKLAKRGDLESANVEESKDSKAKA